MGLGKVLEHVKFLLRKLKVGPLMREYVAMERLMSHPMVPLEEELVRDFLRGKAAVWREHNVSYEAEKQNMTIFR